MPARKTFSTSSWKRLPAGTSLKSARNAAARFADSELGLVTTTSLSVPAGSTGPAASTSTPLTTETIVAGAPPIFTAAPDWKFEPAMTTGVPPEAGPEVGAIEVTVGPGTATH